MDQHELDNRFGYHRPDDQRARAHEQVRGSAKLLATVINTLVPESDEKKEAVKKVEEAMFWANAAIAREAPPVEGTNTTSGWQMDEDYAEYHRQKLVPVRTEFGTVLGYLDNQLPVPADHGVNTSATIPDHITWSPPSALPDDDHRRDA